MLYNNIIIIGWSGKEMNTIEEVEKMKDKAINCIIECAPSFPDLEPSENKIVSAVDRLSNKVGELIEEIKEQKDVIPWDIRMAWTIDEVELSVRSYNCLKKEGLMYLGDIAQKQPWQLLKIKDLGQKSLKEIKLLLEQIGTGLSQKLDGWNTENIEKARKQLKLDPSKKKEINAMINAVEQLEILNRTLDRMADLMHNMNLHLSHLDDCTRENSFRGRYFITRNNY